MRRRLENESLVRSEKFCVGGCHEKDSVKEENGNVMLTTDGRSNRGYGTEGAVAFGFMACCLSCLHLLSQFGVRVLLSLQNLRTSPVNQKMTI